MAERQTLAVILAEPRRGRYAAAVILALLSWIALVLRLGLDTGGALDIDVMNFGLAGFRFDILDHQPHPPGYPGYVVILKLVHLVAPWLDPIALAKWTTTLCGVATVSAAYWACSEVLGGGASARGRSLLAASLTVVHPVLWFYGGDGQSHGAEALVTLLVFAVAMRVGRNPSAPKILGTVFVFALAGSIRPTIPALLSPLLVWLMWRQPVRVWIIGAVIGCATVLAWFVPMIAVAGGFDVFGRAHRALVSDMFVASYSIFGERASVRGVLANAGATGWALVLSSIPIIAAHRRGFARRPWARLVAAITALNIVFFTIMFTAEIGYFIQVAALSTLVFASWPAPSDPPARPLLKLRAIGLAVLCPALLFLGPASLPIPYAANLDAPSYPRAAEQAEKMRIYRELMCGASGGESSLLVTDNYETLNSRWLSVVCPTVVVATYLGDVPLNPKLDNWLFFFADGMDTVPAAVPLEPGPSEVYQTRPVSRVIASLDATAALHQSLEAAARCAPHRFAPFGPGSAMNVWPARCLPELRFGAHTIAIKAASEPVFSTDFLAPR